MRKDAKYADNFFWIANSPWIDFVNTKIVKEGSVREFLDDPNDLKAWLRCAKLIESDDLARFHPDAKSLQFARRYRHSLREAVQALADGNKVPFRILDETNRILRSYPPTPELTLSAGKVQMKLRWNLKGAAAASAPVAYSFARFLEEADLTRVRKCKNPECIGHFYDTSKSGTRSWCSLALCGNRLRMADLRRRKSQS